MGERFLPISSFFSLVSSRAFREGPHSRFRCGDLNKYLLNFLKMLLLALPQIYTRAFYLWKSVALDNARVKDFCPFISFFLLACFREYSDVEDLRFFFFCEDPKLTLFSAVSSRAFRDAPQSRFRRGDRLPNFLKVLLLALSQIYTRVFHLWKFTDLDSVWVRDSRHYQLSFLS